MSNKSDHPKSDDKGVVKNEPDTQTPHSINEPPGSNVRPEPKQEEPKKPAEHDKGEHETRKHK